MNFNTPSEKLKYILTDNTHKIYSEYIRNLISIANIKLYNNVRLGYKLRGQLHTLTDNLRGFYDRVFIKEIDSGKYDECGYLLPDCMRRIRNDLPIIFINEFVEVTKKVENYSCECGIKIKKNNYTIKQHKKTKRHISRTLKNLVNTL